MTTLAIFIPDMSGGGAERAMLNLLQSFNQQGIQVDLVLVSRRGAYLNQVPDNVRILDFGGRKLMRCFPLLWNYLHQEKPDILLTPLDETSLAVLWTRAVSRLVNFNSAVSQMPIVVNVQNNVSTGSRHSKSLKLRWMPWFAKRCFPWAEAVISVSEGVGEDLVRLGIPADKVKVIHNPIVTPALHRQAAESIDHRWFDLEGVPVLVAVGRLTQQKDFPNLLRAFAKARQTRPLKLMILGEGELRSELEALIQTLNLQDDVSLPGFVSNPFAYVARSDLFVLSSLFEGLPTVLIEAMAVGTPVVATDCPSGPHEILQAGHYGPLVKMSSVDELAAAILLRLDQPRNAEALKQRANTYSIEASVNAYTRLFDSLLPSEFEPTLAGTFGA